MPAEPLRLERHYKVPIQWVFDIVTRPEFLAQWWGPEGVTRCDGNLDFTTLGPWDSTMIAGDDWRCKISGQVTRVDPPHGVAFTWGWHDDDDRRLQESHVSIALHADRDGTQLVLTHTLLSDAAEIVNHSAGWTSSLRKLDALLAQTQNSPQEKNA